MAFYCKICCDLLSSKPPSEAEVANNNNNETEGDENEGKLTVTACGHAFHSTCFSRWIKVSEKSKCCPNCLLVIRTEKIHALYLDTGMDRLQDSGTQESASAEVIMREATRSKILAHLRLELQTSLDGIAELENGERRILVEVGNASKGISGAGLRQHVSRGRAQRVATGGTSARGIGQDMEQKMAALSSLEEQAVASRKICVEIFKIIRFLENAIARAVAAARERETAVRRTEPRLGAHPSGTSEASVTSCPSSEGSSASGGSSSVVSDGSHVVAGSSRPVTLARVRFGHFVAAAVGSRPARTVQQRPLVARSSSQASFAGMRGGRNRVEVSTSSRSGGSRWRN